jgi:predicted metalloprotease with PDZ domain
MLSAVVKSNCQSQDVYTVEVSAENLLHLKVDAHLRATDTLVMNPNCPNYDFPEGWSTFVNNLVIKQGNNQIAYRYVKKSKWILTNVDPAVALTVSYSVDLSFCKLKWDVGNEQAGFFDGKAVYIVTKALFIHNNKNTERVINFILPKGLKLEVPWTSVSGKNSFVVRNDDYLLQNTLVYGSFYSSRLKIKNFNFTIALFGGAQATGELFSSALHKIANELMRIFPDTPATTYMISMFYADVDDGESFYNSNAFSSKNPITDNNKIIWANQMAHELFHYWNSDLMRSAAYSDTQWFSEGSAEYFANLILFRTGIIDESLFRKKVEKLLGLYVYYKGWQNPEQSLREAGKSKGKSRFAVYNGGWMACLAIDLIICEETDGAKSMEDVMREMLARYHDKTYTLEDLMNVCSAVAEKDLSGFFSQYILGNELIPTDEFLRKIGYQSENVIYQGEMYLTLTSGALRKQWLER